RSRAARKRARQAWRIDRRAASGGSGRSWIATHQLGDAEREVERLARVQPWVAERHVTQAQILFEHLFGAAETFGHVLACEFEMNSAGPGPLLPVRREEAFDLSHHRVEVTCLEPRVRREDVRMHRIANPGHGMPGLAHGPQEWREQLED